MPASESFPNMKHEFFSLVRRLDRELFCAKESHPGVTPAEERALIGIAIKQAEMSEVRPGLLAAHLHATPSAMSQTLGSLEDKGLIVREHSGSDSRTVTIVATERGSAIAHEAEVSRDEAFRSIIERVGEDEFKRFMVTFSRIVELMEQDGTSVDECSAKGAAPCV